MSWTRIIVPEARKWHTKETAKLRKHLEDQAQQIETNRRSIDEQRKKIEQTPLEELEPEAVFHSDIPQHMLFELLKIELSFRQGLATFYGLEDEDRRAEHQKAWEAFEQIQANVRERLEGIGYKSLGVYERGPGKIEPGWIMVHPEVIAARDRTNDLKQGSPEHRKINEDAIKSITAEMNRLKRKAVAA